VDGRTGERPRELLSVTVVGPYLAHADAYATAAFAMGLAGVRWVDSLPGYAACAATADGRLVTGRGLRHYLADIPRPDASDGERATAVDVDGTTTATTSTTAA
jgi:thiamine biosynthesis lipoprotein ApbE